MRLSVLYALTSPVFGNMSDKTIEPETVRFFRADNFWLPFFYSQNLSNVCCDET